MKNRGVVIRCLPALGLLAALASGDLPAATPIMPFAEVAPGMKGVGRTVFKGTAPEEFSAEVIATFRNILPRKNLILARLDGGPLKDTGVMEGMSGSPVYINGRLIGAVAYSWGFAREPIAGITPIEEMLEMLDRGGEAGAALDSTPTPPAAGLKGASTTPSLLAYPDRMASFVSGLHGRLAPRAAPLSGAGLSQLTPTRPTVILSGFHPDVAASWTPWLEALSLRPVLGGHPGPGTEAAVAAEASGGAAAGGGNLVAGSAFGVTLIRGDLDMTAIGTVTWVDGERILGLGHPFLGMGPTSFPLTRAQVYGHMPSLASSFKLAGPLEEVGVVTQDRFPGLAGRRGAQAAMVPVRVELKHGRGVSRSYRFDLVSDPLLTAGLLNLSLLSLLTAEERSAGEMSLRVMEGSRIQIDGDLEVKLENLYAGEQAALYAAGTVSYMTYLIQNNEERPARIEGINLLFDYSEDRETARIEKIWLDRYTAKPGETLGLRVDVRPYRGPIETVQIPLKIPAEAPEGKALLQVGDSLTLSRMEAVSGAPYFLPRSLDHLVWLLNHIRANHKVYASIIRPDNGAFIAGERLPNLPPSVASVLLSSRVEHDGSSRIRVRSLLDADTETLHAVRGYQKALLEIRR